MRYACVATIQPYTSTVVTHSSTTDQDHIVCQLEREQLFEEVEARVYSTHVPPPLQGGRR